MTAFSRPRRLRNRRGGTTILEVAVVLPVFITFVFGLIEYGRIQMVANVVKNACRQGARYGATQGVTSEEAVARVKQILGTTMNPDAATILVKNASVFDSEGPLPNSASDYESLPNVELNDAEPRQLIVVRATVDYEDIALLPISCLSGMQLTGQAFTRHE